MSEKNIKMHINEVEKLLMALTIKGELEGDESIKRFVNSLVEEIEPIANAALEKSEHKVSLMIIG